MFVCVLHAGRSDVVPGKRSMPPASRTWPPTRRRTRACRSGSGQARLRCHREPGRQVLQASAGDRVAAIQADTAPAHDVLEVPGAGDLGQCHIVELCRPCAANSLSRQFRRTAPVLVRRRARRLALCPKSRALHLGRFLSRHGALLSACGPGVLSGHALQLPSTSCGARPPRRHQSAKSVGRDFPTRPGPARGVRGRPFRLQRDLRPLPQLSGAQPGPVA